MATKAKKTKRATKRPAARGSSKKDLEAKIATLESKLSKLSEQVAAKPAQAPPKPAGAKPKTPEPAKPAGAKPKTPEPAKRDLKAPSTFQEALENSYRTAPTSDFHQYRAKVTGYSPAPNRYFVRLTAPVGKVPTSNWNDQKAKVTGYTQPSNQYFATRARLAYHPPDKTFGSFGNANMSVEGLALKQQSQAPPPPQPAPKPGAMPKGMEQRPQVQASYGSTQQKSKREELAEYEKDYVERLAKAKAAEEKAYQEVLEAEVERRASATRGKLPKGF